MKFIHPQNSLMPERGSDVSVSRCVHALPKRQHGVVLVLTLIVLVAMTLSAIALVRSVDTGNVIAGNMAFKQGATQAGDAGTEAAINFLKKGGVGGIAIAGAPESYVDSPDEGYYATAQDLDMTGNSHDSSRGLVDWDRNSCNSAASTGCQQIKSTSITVGGNDVRYIIHRLCSQAGSANAAGNDCVTYLTQGGQSPKRGEIKYGLDRRFALTPIEIYRITSRIKGPRNTISYIETVVHF
jgi:type IV pilus assembly protein PilX